MRGAIAFLVFGLSACSGSETPRLADVQSLAAPDESGLPFEPLHFEPMIAASGSNPDLVVVASTRRVEAPQGYYSDTYIWNSSDGGTTWGKPFSPAAMSGRYLPIDWAKRGATGDPTILAGDDSTFYYTVLVFHSDSAGNRKSSLFFARSDDGGRTFPHHRSIYDYQFPTVRYTLPFDSVKREGRGGRPTGYADKPWFTLDTINHPKPGRLYVAWTPVDVETKPLSSSIIYTWSDDRGDTFVPPRTLAPWDSSARAAVQIHVRQDGTLLAAWYDILKGLVWATSTDKGASFAVSGTIMANNDTTFVSFPTFLETPRGTMVVWEGTIGPRARSTPTYFFQSELGPDARWSAPARFVATSHADSGMRFPVVAKTRRSDWLFGFHLTADSGTAVLFQSSDGARTWQAFPLSTRYHPPGDRGRPDVGDYMGLASTRGRIYAAFVLPENPTPGQPIRRHDLLFARIDLQR